MGWRQVLPSKTNGPKDCVAGLSTPDFLWALGSLSALHGLPFSPQVLATEFPPESTELDVVNYSFEDMIRAARSLGVRIKQQRFKNPAKDLPSLVFPLLAQTKPLSTSEHGTSLVMITAVAEGQAVYFEAGTNQPKTTSVTDLCWKLEGSYWLSTPETEALKDPDGTSKKLFSFRWFVPELLKHRTVWRDVLLGSLALQLVALATPLFTQAIIDKVTVHRTQSTLIAIGLAMAIFTIFSAVLSWVRQYLILHTGNRVDAVLGQAVWDHLLKLPLAYFSNRPTGVVAARLHGIETIREFVSGAAVTLILDLPFLFICLGVMLWYSVTLSAIAVGIIAIIALVSFVVAPVFQRQLNEQFLLGARTQGFVTEHIAGFETVKTLQMEPQLRKRYGKYLAQFLQSSFKTKQVANTYNTFATTAEQAMTLLILIMGAYTVMTTPEFTIGMLVAFQMFAGKLSQPILRLVGLWSQFQQARLAVDRLGDLMNAPLEPYSVIPARSAPTLGRIEIEGLAFRYSADRPQLFDNLNLVVEPGKTIAIMGPSGTGKSTLAKLLLNFYQPTAGRVLLDGIDIQNLSANELRSYFGVVPQETTLFSGSILANLQAANPAASFDEVVLACKMGGIHETIEQLPQGYQTEIGERGVGLSGGQKQRIAIARALLKNPKILIFDEATSALDVETAESFAKTVNTLKGRVTMVFITHAMPKNLKVDEVLLLSKQGIRQLRGVPQTQSHASASSQDSEGS